MNKLLLVACFLFPVIGIIYYFIKKEDPNRKTYLITSIVSLVLINLIL